MLMVEDRSRSSGYVNSYDFWDLRISPDQLTDRLCVSVPRLLSSSLIKVLFSHSRILIPLCAYDCGLHMTYL